MKTLATAEATATDALSVAHPLSDGAPDAEPENVPAARTNPMGFSRLAQSGRSPVRGSDESAFMKSQLS